jgi:PPP family 3-phenylpropionic acid transporter
MPHRLSSRSVLAANYFIYFGVMGIYLPFFNLYCFEIGFSGWQIGILSATRSIVLILFSVFWSLLADRYQARRPIYILCNSAAAGIWSLFLVTTQFGWILGLSVVYGMFYAPIIAFLETFSMENLGPNKKRYGGLRAWGSVAFITVVLVLGPVTEAFGVRIILGLILAGSWMQVVVAWGIPGAADIRRGLSGRAWRRLAKPRLLFFWGGAFLMLVSHGAYYTFFSIHLARMGFGKSFIGLCWALASCAEIMIMLNSERFFKRFSYEIVLIAAFAVAALRWTGLWLAGSAWLLLLLQLAHAVTYGAFHMAGILYTDHHAPGENKTLAQSVTNAVTYGLGMMVGAFLSGFLYERGGAGVMFMASAGIALAGGAVFSGYVLFARRGTGFPD